MEELNLALQNLEADRQRCKDAITYRGGTISSTMGFKDLKRLISTLPSSSSVGTVINEEIATYKSVPTGSTKFCYMKSLGGMTYKCNNLIPYPYHNTTNTSKGITFTDNGDGTITLNGTAETNVGFTFQLRTEFTLPKGTYTLSGFPSGLDASCYLIVSVYNGSTWVGELLDNGNSITKDISNLTYTGCQVAIHISAGTVCNNLVVKPMLNIGTTALPYEPYYEGLRDNKVTAIKSYGAQLIPFPYYDNKGVGYTYTSDGVTFTVNADRSITIDTNGGTSRGVSFLLANYLDLPSGSYTIAAYCVGGTWTGNNTNSPYVSGTGLGGQTYPISTRPTATISTKPVWYSINVPNGAVVDNVTLKVMLNKGSIAVPYQDYHEPATYLIPESLQGTGKGVEGASDTIDFENDKFITKTHTIVFDGTENITSPYEGKNGYREYIYILSVPAVNNASTVNIVCNHYPSTTRNIQYKLESLAMCASSSWLRFTDVEMTVDEMKAKLKAWYDAGDPLTVTYAIAEPTETDIDTSAFDHLIEVEGGGSIEFITDSGYAPNSTVIFQTF